MNEIQINDVIVEKVTKLYVCNEKDVVGIVIRKKKIDNPKIF